LTCAETITPSKRLLITISVMLATLMQVLDTTIVNVALPHMQGSLAATPDQVPWVLTSYLVSSAICMPLTGYFSDILGRKNYLLICMSGFIVASALCGAATTLPEIVCFRLMQGVFGAGLVPLSQAILADVYLPEERGKAMALWGMGVMVGPILGPTLGGYLTEVASWRWTFYINVPFGLFALFLAWQVVPKTPKKTRHMDWWGLLFLSVAIGATQFFLDRGNQDDWFSSMTITIAAVLAVAGAVAFGVHSTKPKQRMVFDISIFKDRNFTVSSILLAVFGLSLFGSMVIFPLMLENLMNYPVLTTGLVMAPRGVGSLLSTMLMGRLIKHFDPKVLVATGIVICLLGSLVTVHYNLEISPSWIVVPMFFQGFGLGMIFVPLSAVAFSTLPASSRAEGAGLYSLLRTLGSSIGISVVVTLFTRMTQADWNYLGGFINPYNPALQHYLQIMQTRYSLMPAMQPTEALFGNPVAFGILQAELSRQAQMTALVDTFAFINFSMLFMLPLVLLLKSTHKKSKVPASVPESGLE